MACSLHFGALGWQNVHSYRAEHAMTSGISLSALLVVAALALPAISRAEDTADLILRHGVFYPVEPATPITGSMAVRGGRITFLGDDAGAMARRGPQTEVVELGGRAVTPGLIDAHSHLSKLGLDLASVDLRGASTYQEVVDRIKTVAARRSAGSWIFGSGWDQNLWPDRAFPTHTLLSQAVPDHPVWLDRIDGHAALVNAAAMAILGLSPSTVDPVGGRFLRDAQGAPTGVAVDNGIRVISARVPRPSAEVFQQQLRLAAERCVSLGLTTVTDMGVDDSTYTAYEEIRHSHPLPLRSALFVGDDPRWLDHWFSRGPELDPEARLQVRGVKLYVDGALGSRGAALIEPYSDDPGNLGLLVSTGDHLEDVARRAVKAGFQVAIHAIGDRGGLIALDAMEKALAGAGSDRRFRLEHAQILRVEDIERMAHLGVIASMQPTHATSDMAWVPDRLGERRLERAYAWRKVLNAGGHLALGSDFPVESPDPRLGLYAAVTRQDRAGKPAGGWLPGERLTREEALRGFTLDAAWSLFLDQEVGSLTVGKRADFVVFAQDPMRVPVAELATVPVDLTFVEGRVVYRRLPSPERKGG
jgi:predicted amidohydrolase YtcJ